MAELTHQKKHLEAALTTGDRIEQILAQVKPLAVEFYKLSGKPLGVTGEVAEYVAAKLLDLELVAARTVGYDALSGMERIQIKGRAFSPKAKKSQRMSRIKRGAPCDSVMLVLLDNATLDAVEIWKASYADVEAELLRPGSKSRNERGALSVSCFKRIGRLIWPQSRL